MIVSLFWTVILTDSSLQYCVTRYLISTKAGIKNETSRNTYIALGLSTLAQLNIAYNWFRRKSNYFQVQNLF